jgi:transketolase
MVFLTGDLGFMALEPLRDRLHDRFINCGVAEQNMMSVAASLAREKLEVWVYSIAPFCYARPFEQIRNDICFHGLPVRLLGNGGGYGYGVMGPTHHAIEDYGALLTLPEMAVYVPAFNEDVADVVERAGASVHPCYIRLGRGEWPIAGAVPVYSPWRQLTVGNGPVVIVAGPLAGPAFAVASELNDCQPNLWVVSEMPLTQTPPPSELADLIRQSQRLCVIEEHVSHGGLGAMLSQWVLQTGLPVRRYAHLYARGYPSHRYGSQTWHRRDSGLDPESIRQAVMQMAVL